jgi:predicted HD phosphohydrolase
MRQFANREKDVAPIVRASEHSPQAARLSRTDSLAAALVAFALAQFPISLFFEFGLFGS